jgi:cation:H+ antiporter
MAATLLAFLVSAGALVAAGIQLARAGDVVADGTGLGRMWVGAILVAAATSLPELTTDVSAVRQGHPTLAVGDLFGSSMANMLVLAVADLLTRRTRILARVAVNQLAVGTIAICLTTIAMIAMRVHGWTLGGIGWGTAVIVLAYVAGMVYLHRNRGEPPFEARGDAETAAPSRAAVRRAILRFAVAGAVVLVSGPFLASSTAGLADHAGLSHAFAGLLLLAVTTSMPEASVTLASLRAGSHDLAVGNLFGSNCFNMAALLALDLADGSSSVLASVDDHLVVSALAGVLLTGLAMLGVLDRAERTARRLDPIPLLMIGLYVVALALNYREAG